MRYSHTVVQNFDFSASLLFNTPWMFPADIISMTWNCRISGL